MEIVESHTETICRRHCTHVFSTLAYFSIFRHPLKRNEIEELIHFESSGINKLDDTLEFLVNKKLIQYCDGFYFLNADDDAIDKRSDGEIAAQIAFHKASRHSRLISMFPFVRSVFISGSLSKNYMDNNSDIDYFIVTNPERLWICRTLLILYKKIFLFNSHHYFCLNYFVDENNLSITDRNIFTATELLFLYPMFGKEDIEKLYEQNKWAHDFYPNKKFRSTNDLKDRPFYSKTFSKKSFHLKFLIC